MMEHIILFLEARRRLRNVFRGELVLPLQASLVPIHWYWWFLKESIIQDVTATFSKRASIAIKLLGGHEWLLPWH
jgi:hypothetical protein